MESLVTRPSLSRLNQFRSASNHAGKVPQPFTCVRGRRPVRARDLSFELAHLSQMAEAISDLLEGLDLTHHATRKVVIWKA